MTVIAFITLYFKVFITNNYYHFEKKLQDLVE